MKLKINIILKGIGFLLAMVAFVVGLINILKGIEDNLTYVVIIFSCVPFAFYIAEWFVTRAWFRIAYWLLFIIAHLIMLMDKDNTRILVNLNASMFIFSIAYAVIMAIAFGILLNTYIKSKRNTSSDNN